MNRILIGLAAVALFSTATLAQAYPDVPTGHWAYDAITELSNDGIVKGYPDGTFKGNRNLTRYEFALAIRDALNTLKSRISALESASNKPIPAPTVIPKTETVVDPKVASEHVKLSADSVKLQKLSVEFQDELAALGVDVESLKKDNADLQKRVAAIEASLVKLKIGVDLNLIVRADQIFSGSGVSDLNGVSTRSGGLLSNVSVLHDLALNLDAKLSDTASGSATILVSNYLSFLNGSASQYRGYNENPNTDIAIWKAAAKLPVSVFGQPVDVTIGRYENQINPFILWRNDNDLYANVPAYDNGNYSTDGAKLATSFGNLSLGVFAGKNNTVKSNDLTNLVNGSFQALDNKNNLDFQQSAGATLGYIINDNVSLSGAYAAFGYEPLVVGPRLVATNRLEAFGGGLKVNNLIGGVSAYLDFAQSDLNKNDVQKENTQNYVISTGVGYAVNENLKLNAGYLEVQPNFAAPGSWGRVGGLINPAGVKGGSTGINWSAGKFGLGLVGGWYETIRTTAAVPVKLDNLSHVLVKLSYAVNQNLSLGLDYENVVWNQRNTGYSPAQTLVTLNSTLNIAENAALRLLYQVVDVRSAATNGASIFGSAGTSGVAITQLSVKF